MVKTKSIKSKHIPVRTCVGCRQTAPKRSLIRVVAAPGGVVIDPTGKINGRGAYLHLNSTCWENGLKGPLSRALKIELTEKDKDVLTSYHDSIIKQSAT